MFIKIITLIIVALFLLRLGEKLKNKELTFKVALAWGLLWFAAGVVVLYPRLADEIASALGLQTATGIDLAAYAAVGVVFYLVFRLYVRLDRIEHLLTRISRHIALREDREKQD